MPIIPRIRKAQANSAPPPPPVPKPGEVISMVDWRLTGPVNSLGELFFNSYILDANGNTIRNPTPNDPKSTAFINSEEQTAVLSNPYFYVSTDFGVQGVNFVSPVFGSCTRPDQLSNHTRAELRGLMFGPGATEPTEFRRNNAARLSGTCYVKQRPAATGDIDICQIHPFGSEVFFLMILRANGTLQGKAFRRDQASADFWTLRTGVQNNQKISYQVQYGPDNNIRTLISINDDTATLITRPVESAWATVDQHFAAGTYSNTDATKSLDYPKAVNGLLNPADVTDRGHVFYTALTQELTA